MFKLGVGFYLKGFTTSYSKRYIIDAVEKVAKKHWCIQKMKLVFQLLRKTR